MLKLKTLVLFSVCLACTAGLSACQTATDNSKDYTLKTVKWSPAPRDKFYRIVKVPKSADSQVTDPEASSTSSDNP